MLPAQTLMPEQIGKTSAVVLTLSGVLKDILLVVSSLVIFGDPVTGQQYFGYSIALGGLVYYKLGVDKLRSMVGDAKMYINETRVNNPSKVKRGLIYVAMGISFLLLLGWWRTATGGSVVPLTPTPGA